jgi:hypothetical protein
MTAPDPSPDAPLDELIARADLDGLIRLIDGRCATRDWSGVRRVRDASRAAVTTGRQLWPAATLAEYRLALWAEAQWAVSVLDEDSGRFTIGPLTEVIAQHHTFAEMAPHLTPGPRAAFVAHERVLRGDAIDDTSAAELPDVLELPYALQPWEPAYLVPEYSDTGVADTAPPPVDARWFTDIEPVAGSPLPDDEIDQCRQAVRDLVEPWTAHSNGRAEVVGVEGGPAEALHALGLRHATATQIAPHDALSWLAWAGASGGAHARRRGGALGRFNAWWTVIALTGIEHTPTTRLADLADDIGFAVRDWRWWLFDSGEPTLGWSLQMVAEDPLDGIAFAISAHDAV